MLALITGGARSGKSSFAERYAASFADSGVYVATSEVYDEEMGERVQLHRQQREQSGFDWATIEEPLELAELLRGLSSGEPLHDQAESERKDKPVVLVDCLTLWLSNRLLQYENEPKAEQTAQMERIIEELVASAAAFRGTLLLVTNEVGSGIVPEYPLGRRFRDLAGRLNQRLAGVSDQLFLVTAGVPVELKQHAFRF